MSPQSFQLLHRLPEELLQDVISRLSKDDLSRLNLTSKWGYAIATPGIWREVELMDCRTEHLRGGYEGDVIWDDHDDTPLLRKLVLLATKPFLASCVQSLTHRCHLPPPSIFQELPRMTFSAQTLSPDLRTIRLIRMAVDNMRNVHTLRIILGHPNLTDALLRCFFDKRRLSDLETKSGVRVRRLWLENCRISAGLNISLSEHPQGLPTMLSFEGLETVRFRRLPMKPGTTLFDGNISGFSWNYSRGGTRRSMQDGLGGQYITSTNSLNEEIRAGEDHFLWTSGQRIHPDEKSPTETLFENAHTFDNHIFERLASEIELPPEVMALGSKSLYERSVQAYRGSWLDPEHLMYAAANLDWMAMQREKTSSSDAAMKLLNCANRTLTSLNLDWVLTVPQDLGWSRDPVALAKWCGTFGELFSLRFPHLRAFQLRNCVVPDTLLPDGLYLLDRSFPKFRDPTDPVVDEASETTSLASVELAGLSFLEAHPSLQCLGWPMDHFFAPRSEPNPLVAERIDAVINNLGRTLTDLRVDTLYSDSGEPMSAEDELFNQAPRASRRRFVAEFSSRMTKIESIKIEGGMPRDERREIIRSLHRCPLKKIVMIGVCSPLGNTWGENGIDMRPIAAVNEDDMRNLEGEDKAIVHELGITVPSQPPPDFRFQPYYQWSGCPPMLHVIASYHANTIRELKFCGYKGSSVLFNPMPITKPILTALKHFHNLESIIMSMWLTTTFEGDSQDAEVIKYWVNSRSAASTALVHITDDEPEGWEKELRTKYAPDALAWRITNFIGPYLSETAKARKGGVHVRASFCVGDWGGIFDVDLYVGKGSLNSDVCLGFKGPREELEKDRRRGKLEGRRWF